MHATFYVIFLFTNIWCFNIDTDFPIVYKDPQGDVANRSYFGYSVVLYPGSKDNPQKWIKIGAPRSGPFHIGTVYHCPIDDDYQECRNLSFPEAEYSVDKAAREVREGNWIGGTMDISYRYNCMVVCGFRRHFHQETRTRKGTIDVDYRTIGGCYWSNLNTDIFEDVIGIKDTFLGEPTIRATGGMLYQFGQAEAGFSAYFSDADNEFIIGAPGNYDHSGGVVKIRESYYEPPIESRRRRAVVPFSLEISPQHYDISYHYDLLGYSVTSGQFFDDQKLYYAAGAPKGIQTDPKKGKVYIFQFQGNQKLLLEKDTIVGEQLGAYFGSSIAAGKINKDGFDDLIVAAPFYKENSYNEGKVYVFLGGSKNFVKSTTLTGKVTNGQFGTAIMYLEDIDHDGYGDVAISAPHENELGGVVYIFKGQPSGFVEKPSQIIQGKQILNELRGFGMSFSRPADMDGNDYKDIAIGSALSGHAVLLRTRPVVVISNSLQVTPNVLENTDENITLKACFQYNEYQEESISISYDVKVDRLRLLFSEDLLTLYKNNLTCKEYNVSLESNFMDEQEIYATLSYSLLEPPSKKGVTIVSENAIVNDNFCKTCPVLDKYRSSPNETTIKIPIKLDCGDDRICESNLVVTANITEVAENDTFLIGSSPFLTLETSIENLGENAYVTKLEVTLPDELQFIDNVNRCKFSKNRSTALCLVDNPLKQYTMKQLTLTVDMRSVSRYSNLKDFLITFKASTASNDTQTDNFYSYLVNLKYADVTISGWSEQKTYVLENELKDYKVFNITHTYRVGKTGPTTLDKLVVKVNIPDILVSPNGDIPLLRLHQPYIHFKGKSTKCIGNFHFLSETNPTEKTAAYTMEDDPGYYPSRRKKREVTNAALPVDDEIEIYDNTLFLNCSSTRSKCSVLQCPFNLFEDQNDFAEIKIRMEFEASSLVDINSFDMILISTDAEIEILSPEHFQQSGNSPDRAAVSTVFKKEGLSSVALWIIILAIILGILLLILIIIGLIKLGFFKRKIREELRSLKSQQSVEEQAMNQNVGSPDEDDYEMVMEIVEDQELHPVDLNGEKIDLEEQTEDKPLHSSTEGLLDGTS